MNNSFMETKSCQIRVYGSQCLVLLNNNFVPTSLCSKESKILRVNQILFPNINNFEPHLLWNVSQ